MRLWRLHRVGFTVWLCLIALVASGIAQNQLSANILAAKLAEASGSPGALHVMPDGTLMAGAMPAVDRAGEPGADGADAAGGHTNKGHADCSMCGAVAALAALSLPLPDTIALPVAPALAADWLTDPSIFAGAYRLPYASRAPPTPMS